jgi:hypothetical protein
MTPTQLPEILQGKIEFNKYAGKPVEAKLITILCEASMFNPAFTYKVTDTHGYGDKEKISSVAVYEGAQPVGKIGASMRYRRNDNEPVFEVSSEGINKRRGTQSTKHLKIAVKVIKEMFKPAPIEKRAEELGDTVSDKINRMVRRAADHVEGSVRMAAREVVAFLAEYDELETKPAKVPTNVMAKLPREWRMYIDNHRISRAVQASFSTNTGACLRIEDDGSLSMWDMATKEFTEHKSTYELPTNYQEKITILKLMDEDQPVEHIGVKFSDFTHTNGVRRQMTYFFLVAGDTYVVS